MLCRRVAFMNIKPSEGPDQVLLTASHRRAYPPNACLSAALAALSQL
jgi:hypothetical protein